MNLMERLCLFVLLLVSVYGPTTTSAAPGLIGQQCIPGEQKTMGCNGCFCDENGMWVCTQEYCDPLTVPVIVTPVQICTPNTIKWEFFKICVCNESGLLWNCTRINCFPPLPIIFETDPTDAPLPIKFETDPPLPIKFETDPPLPIKFETD